MRPQNADEEMSSDAGLLALQSSENRRNLLVPVEADSAPDEWEGHGVESARDEGNCVEVL